MPRGPLKGLSASGCASFVCALGADADTFALRLLPLPRVQRARRRSGRISCPGLPPAAHSRGIARACCSAAPCSGQARAWSHLRQGAVSSLPVTRQSSCLSINAPGRSAVSCPGDTGRLHRDPSTRGWVGSCLPGAGCRGFVHPRRCLTDISPWHCSLPLPCATGCRVRLPPAPRGRGIPAGVRPVLRPLGRRRLRLPAPQARVINPLVGERVSRLPPPSRPLGMRAALQGRKSRINFYSSRGAAVTQDVSSRCLVGWEPGAGSRSGGSRPGSPALLLPPWAARRGKGPEFGSQGQGRSLGEVEGCRSLQVPGSAGKATATARHPSKMLRPPGTLSPAAPGQERARGEDEMHRGAGGPGACGPNPGVPPAPGSAPPPTTRSWAHTPGVPSFLFTPAPAPDSCCVSRW